MPGYAGGVSTTLFEQTGRRIKVEIDGVTVADSEQVVELAEGSLPRRYYFPKSDVRFDLLTPTDTSTVCSWKGTARYWSAVINGNVYRDILWGYDEPMDGAEQIAGLVSFYNDKVDIEVCD